MIKAPATKSKDTPTNPPLSLEVLLHPSRALMLGWTQDAESVVALLKCHGFEMDLPPKNRNTWISDADDAGEAADVNGERAKMLGLAFGFALKTTPDQTEVYQTLQVTVASSS